MNNGHMKIARYVLLPGIIPRFSALLRSGFYHIAYLIAVIFQMTGIFSRDHIYLYPENFGLYGIRDVLAQGYARLDFSWRHADRVLIYFSISSGLVLLMLQIALFFVSLVSGDVMAQAVLKTVDSAYSLDPWVDWFTLSDAYSKHDIALMTLDRVFGVKGIFDSCVSLGVACETYAGDAIVAPTSYPSAMHRALHAMLEFYSYGILFVAVIIIMYFVITITVETAQTGTPFGKRYSKAWAPIRLILFFALLAPLNLGGTNSGLNGAQILTLYMAKLGSNMASNAWGWYGNRLSHEFLGDKQNLLAKPKMPEMGGLGQFLFVAKTCVLAKTAALGDSYPADKLPDAYVVSPFMLLWDSGATEVVDTVSVAAMNAEELSALPYTNARENAKNGSIIIRFGSKDSSKNATDMGHVDYECGELTLTVTDRLDDAGRSTGDLQQIYYNFIQKFWKENVLTNPSRCFLGRNSTLYPDSSCSEWPDPDLGDHFDTMFESEVQQKLKAAIDAEATAMDWDMSDSMKKKGWATAAAWYNQVASMNGVVTGAVFNFPQVTKWPRALEEISEQKRTVDDSTDSSEDRFLPAFGSGLAPRVRTAGDAELGILLHAAFKVWEEDGVLVEDVYKPSGNVILDAINFIFGTSGLLSIRENEDAHPLATLSVIGKGIMEATMRNLLVSSGIASANILKLFGKNSPLKQITGAIGSFLKSTAFALIVIGAILFYVVPFMPFIYFFFAVSGWIKSIFEAMVAMPLWALAHLRIDGQGVPGPAATNGYFLLLEIVLRPTMILIGLVASIAVFAATVFVLNDVFDVVVSNLTGHDQESTAAATLTDIAYYRAGLDQFMYTIIYTILVYMLGLSSFKLIDQIPNQIMRWGGSAAATFQENAGDPAGQVNRQFYRGGTLLTSPMQGGQLALLMS